MWSRQVKKIEVGNNLQLPFYAYKDALVVRKSIQPSYNSKQLHLPISKNAHLISALLSVSYETVINCTTGFNGLLLRVTYCRTSMLQLLDIHAPRLYIVEPQIEKAKSVFDYQYLCLH